MEDAFIDSGSLYHAAIRRNVAVKYGDATILHIGMVEVADATACAVGVEGVVVILLAAEGDVVTVAWSAFPHFLGFCAKVGAIGGIFVDCLGKSGAIDTFNRSVDNAVFGELAHDCHDSSGTVDILDVVF